MKVKRYLLSVLMMVFMIGLFFCLGLNFNSAKRLHKAKVIGDREIKNMTDESYMNETSLMMAEAYEIKRVFQNSDDAQAVVYINKKDGKILNCDAKDMAYVRAD